MTKNKAITKTFEAEITQLLDIVIHSLYKDPDIFLRELISNASDASEKLRFQLLKNQAILEPDLPLEITLSANEEAKTITITDHGIGFTESQLVENLGKIAHSGTREFLTAVKESGEMNSEVIGQFGVGFYSVFMVANKVEVKTHSFEPSEKGYVWISDGKSGYSIEEMEGISRGTSIVLHLKEGSEKFAKESVLKELVKRFSNFIGFPIKFNEEEINQQQALWLKSKKEITKEEYEEFYKVISHMADVPIYKMHFSADAPLVINALLFVPGENPERFGMGQTEPNVSLYCRKVLIDKRPDQLLPEWLRFLHGVIDSEDLPLNISRESMQDTALIKKIGQLVTKRFLKFLAKEAKSDEEAYLAFYQKFSRFLKEGAVVSFEHQATLLELLRFESSMTEVGKLTCFADYVSRMKEEQKEIYYLVGENRQALEKSPYLEAFKVRKLEVIFFADPVDSYLVDALNQYQEKPLRSINQEGIEMEDLTDKKSLLSKEQASQLVDWWKKEFSKEVEEVCVGKRLVDRPVAVFLNQEQPNAQMKAMMKSMGQELPEAKPKLEINAKHPLIKKISKLIKSDPDLAKSVSEQLTQGALLGAGCIDDTQATINLWQEGLLSLLESKG